MLINYIFKYRYRVHIKNITAEGEVMFRIYPSAYWEPLQVKQNHTLYVEESTSVLISRDVLEVGFYYKTLANPSSNPWFHL